MNDASQIVLHRVTKSVFCCAATVPTFAPCVRGSKPEVPGLVKPCMLCAQRFALPVLVNAQSTLLIRNPAGNVPRPVKSVLPFAQNSPRHK